MKIFVIIFCSFLSFAVFASNEVQNGGGGVETQGHYMTFYSAQVPVGPAPEMANAIPGLTYLMRQVQQMNLTDEVKSQLNFKIYPLAQRQYYKVDEKALDQTDRLKILSEYSKIYGDLPNNVVIFAATDPKAGSTFLFPEFYQLSEIEQAVILLHEAAWLLNSRASYNSVVELEQAAQAYFENPDDAGRYYRFYTDFATAVRFMEITSNISLRAALIYDRDHAPGKKSNDFLAKNILGDRFLDCFYTKAFNANTNADNSANGVVISAECSPMISMDLFARIAKSATPMIDQSLLEYLSSNSGNFNFYIDDFAHACGPKCYDAIILRWNESEYRFIRFDLINGSGLAVGHIEFR